MAQYQRPSAQKDIGSGGIGTGVILARVVSHLDPSFMGSLEVALLKDQGNTIGDDAQTYIVRYASPFFGYTPFEFMGKNTGENSTIDGFNDTQKSYGMWMVPPDVGVNVLVIFVDGDPAQGYWIACVPAKNANHMVPAIAGSTDNQLDKNDKQKYGNTKLPLPVAEMNKRINGAGDQALDPEKIKKPVHPIADRFLEQGLLEDDIRGTTTTTSRREAPSSVFGISTPGPLDRRVNSKKSFLGKILDLTQNTVPVSRLGGTQFVMDDGDDKFRREKPASEGPVRYVDVLTQTIAGTGEVANSQGQPDIPYNEYFRVRTRTGHQLLMHNSEDLIYIGNARGTAWVELTSNGKIDIYAADSISIHSETDLNIRADRDINMEAGRNMNFRTASGKWHCEIATNLEFLVNVDSKITVGSNMNILVGASTKISSNTDFDLATGGDNKFSAVGNTSIGSGGDHKETAATINMNSSLAAESAVVADFVQPYELRDNPVTSTTAGWQTKRYQSGVVSSIMKRIPMHEPWPLHENQAPDQQRPDNTDRDV
jgi:hypothetical protein